MSRADASCGDGAGQANSNPPPPLAGLGREADRGHRLGGRGEGAVPTGKETMLSHARSMCRYATPAERRLWQAVRKHRTGGLKFRRQVPLGPYIADFYCYCPSAHLVIELDGATHTDTPNDEVCDAWMNQQGIRVLRIPNDDVLRNLEFVLVAIEQAAQTPPPPSPPACGLGPLRGPSPRGEGENRNPASPSSRHRHV